jgi:proline racemase
VDYLRLNCENGALALDEIVTTDYHTAGEPFRIVVGGGPELPGRTVLERREAAAASESAEATRRLLCHEPRGHADMYGCFLVPPDDAGAELGAVFWHKDGYSTACGHGTIALGAWAVESGRVAPRGAGVTPVAIDAPSGRVLAQVRVVDGAVEAVSFRNVPAFVLARSLPVRTSRGTVEVDVAYGGAIYASVAAASAGLEVVPRSYAELIAFGREVKAALAGSEAARHPSDDRLSGVYGTIVWQDLGRTGDGLRQRNVTVFADGEVDRSPCGSGTSARLALLVADAALADGEVLVHESIVGTVFRAGIVERTTGEGRDAVVTEVEGAAYRTGEHRFVLDPRDPLGAGFTLR